MSINNSKERKELRRERARERLLTDEEWLAREELREIIKKSIAERKVELGL